MLSLRLGQLAITAGCTTADIKRFLQEGILPAPHLKGTKLEGFDQGHVDRLELILACHAADLALREEEWLGIAEQAHLTNRID